MESISVNPRAEAVAGAPQQTSHAFGSFRARIYQVTELMRELQPDGSVRGPQPLRRLGHHDDWMWRK